MNNLTDKTFVIGLRGGYKIWINKQQSDNVITGLEGNAKFIRTDNGIFKAEDVIFVLPASEVEREEKIKRGEWQCEYGQWHAKGQECGHAEEAKYK